MSWKRYRTSMENDVIKVDNIGAEDKYFLATHMPFTELEVYQGDTMGSATIMDEDKIFHDLVCNEENQHRLVVVRGDNGTGKSHLIRYFYDKFIHSSSIYYNPDTEQVIFLRRLNNSVRGVFAQLLDQKAIRDPEIEQRLRRFVDSSSSTADETAFKTDILYSYISAVRGDGSGKVYSSTICRDIASFLGDSRVTEYLLREDGPISRCYQVITAPSDQVMTANTIFSVEDFDAKRLLKPVIKQGDPQAMDFATTLKTDEDEIVKLVEYLNGFTREVVQRCAGISSEGAKEVFELLRKDLKKQGKNLTLFIEDFTGFTGIDSELITAVSTPHTGMYSELCRVTAVIGITNDYFHQFRDNFKERVTHQVSVTERTFGSPAFIGQMAGRYLNAIYCDPHAMDEWYNHGGDISELPISDFKPPCSWDSVEINGKAVTLYPFNKKSLTRLFNGLSVKSPRTFLISVLRSQLKEFFDGKEYGTNWRFPLNPTSIPMENNAHASTIDRLPGLSAEDKNRIKAVLAIWGDGTANESSNESNETVIGAIPKAFFDSIGLEEISAVGYGGGEDGKSGEDGKDDEDVEDGKGGKSGKGGEDDEDGKGGKKRPKPPTDLERRVIDINSWFSNGDQLQYHNDYRTYIREFLVGINRSSGAIPWQDLDIPAFIVDSRFSDLTKIYIEGQQKVQNKNIAKEDYLVYLERNAESKDLLLALCNRNYAKGWNFGNSAYYQTRAIVWLEKNKQHIIEQLYRGDHGENLPIFRWCLALQYLKAATYGQPIDNSSPLAIVKSLMEPINKDNSIKRVNEVWGSLEQFIEGQSSVYDSTVGLLRQASATIMGAVAYAKDVKEKKFYRTAELLQEVQYLEDHHWNIMSELPDVTKDNLLYNPAKLLAKLYPRVEKVLEQEKVQSEQVLQSIKGYVGDITVDNLLDLYNVTETMFSDFKQYGIPYKSELESRFSGGFEEKANRILQWFVKYDKPLSESLVPDFYEFSDNSLAKLNDFLSDLVEIERMAVKEESKAKQDLSKLGVSAEFGELNEAAFCALRELYDMILPSEDDADAQTND